MAEYTVTNPATNTVVCSVATATDAAVSRADAPTAPGDESPSPSAPHLAAVAREYRAPSARESSLPAGPAHVLNIRNLCPNSATTPAN